ncbi:hypothetical protein BGZ99_005803 [Dissophora globulifera]|uniref:LUD domain-containing protein n=1 Tax=Dissophora globulifera TaxID=979702 RepID=A0A9P6USW2_9FUNG|nr:hypothetical protein BGZ99_005803 [Dissophora globulifera]
MSTRPANTHVNITFEALVNVDEQIAHLKDGAYSKAASPERFETTRAALEAKGFKVTVAEDKDDAFEKLRSLIPAGVSLNNAHSTTLEEIGFVDYLKGETSYNNVHAAILAETDPIKQATMRRVLGTTVDYFLTSMAAVTENGELAHGDFSGTKVGGVSYGAKNVIVVVGSNKIVKDEAEAYKRTMEWCVPVACAFTRQILNIPGTEILNYELIRGASPLTPGRIHILFIKEALGV